MRPRLGFLGVGWIGRNRLEAVARGGHAQVVAVCDPAAGEAVSRELGVPAVAYEDLLGADIDGLVIATPSALHAAQAQAALARDIAVFCQKPLGRHAREVRAVVDAARRADRLLGVDLSYRFTAAGQALHGLIASGELGEIYAAQLVFHNAYGPDKPWFYDRVQSGGGCLIDLGIHLVDLALWCLGFPAVTHVAATLHGGDVEDHAAAQLVAGGAAVQLACSWRLPAGRDAVIEASFYGSRGGATLRNLAGSFYDLTCERFTGTRRQTITTPPDEWSGRAAVAWADRLAAGERFDWEAERFTAVAEVLDRLYAAGGVSPGISDLPTAHLWGRSPP